MQICCAILAAIYVPDQHVRFDLERFVQAQCELVHRGAPAAERNILADRAAASMAGETDQPPAHDLAALIFRAPALPASAGLDARPGIAAVPSPAALPVMQALKRILPEAGMLRDALNTLPVATLVSDNPGDSSFAQASMPARLQEMLQCEAVTLQSAGREHCLGTLQQHWAGVSPAAKHLEFSTQQKGALQRLQHLDLCNSEAGLGADAAACFAACMSQQLFRGLTFLALRNVPLQGTAMHFTRDALPHLAHLDVAWTRSSSADERTVHAHSAATISLLTNTCLTHLNLAGRQLEKLSSACFCSSHGAVAQACSAPESDMPASTAILALTSLQHLDVSGLVTADTDAESLTDGITNLTALTSLVGQLQSVKANFALLSACWRGSLPALRHLDLSVPESRCAPGVCADTPMACPDAGSVDVQLTALLLGGRSIGAASMQALLQRCPALRLLEASSADMSTASLACLHDALQVTKHVHTCAVVVLTAYVSTALSSSWDTTSPMRCEEAQQFVRHHAAKLEVHDRASFAPQTIAEFYNALRSRSAEGASVPPADDKRKGVALDVIPEAHGGPTGALSHDSAAISVVCFAACSCLTVSRTGTPAASPFM